MAGGRGPVASQGGTRAQRKHVHDKRQQDMEAQLGGKRGPLADPDSRRMVQRLRASMGMHHLRLGPPFKNDDELDSTLPSVLKVYRPFIVDWEQFGLSDICSSCLQLSTTRHCRGKESARVCERCRQAGGQRALPKLAEVAPVLAGLTHIERQLISTMKTSQYLLSLPSGGPTGQWGRLYVTALPEPQVCEVLADAVVSHDGLLHVKQPGGQQPAPARLEAVLLALRHLQASNKNYRGTAVQAAIETLSGKLLADDFAPSTAEDLELDYLIAAAPAPPEASHVELKRARGSAEMQDNLDARAFPHLFPEGVGGIDAKRKFAEYVRARLLNVDPRFEQSPDYIYFLLEYWLKKKIAGNTSVRIGLIKQSRTPDTALRHAVYTTMRDIPGTQPYMYTKRSMAISMFEQLGPPQWFLTLTCHARQPSILLACIYARLQRRGQHPERDLLRREAAGLLHEFLQNEEYQWDGHTANQLCNACPAVVSRQFFHQVRRFMRWLAGGIQDRDQPAAVLDDDDTNVLQPDAPCVIADGAQEIAGVEKPFQVKDYIIRVEWQKRGYPHAHVLLWSETRATVASAAGTQRATAEEMCDRYISTASPKQWEQQDLPVMQKLAHMMVHKCSAYCGRYTLGACRFGFPHRAEPKTRRKTGREQWGSRSKSVFAVRREDDAAMMGQYNPAMLLKWRGSMDLQYISDVDNASKYILGYTLKAEEDVTSARRFEQLIRDMTQRGDINHQAVYKAAHAALQGRTTSTFEACHLMLGLPVVQFSRGNVWVQAGPPSTWVVSVPKKDESLAIAHSEAYRHDPEHRPSLPLAQRQYAEMQKHFASQLIHLPVEEGDRVEVCWSSVTFFDFCAGMDFQGKEEPVPRHRPALVGHRNYSPDLEPEEFYYSKLLLHTVWREPGGWLQPEDGGSHAAAFSRVAADALGHPNFLQSRCFPSMDGTVAAARQLQKVQATMYLKSLISGANASVPSVEQEKYEGALQIMHALRQRHGTDIMYDVPDFVPSGLAAEAFAPVDGGEEAFRAITEPQPSPEVRRQQRLMVYILHRIIDAPSGAVASGTARLQLLVHGPGGCGKSFVLRAVAHKLRQSGRGVVIAAYTGAAAFNVGGVTLHQCCALPVTNKSYGQHSSDVPAPQGARLQNLRSLWASVDVLCIDEISMVSSDLFKTMDKNLQLARNRPDLPFGGVHLVAFGDLYQLPPPLSRPIYAAALLWKLFELCELTGNHRAALDPDWARLLGRVRVGKWTESDLKILAGRVTTKKSKFQPADAATHLFATRAAVSKFNLEKLEHHLNTRSGIEYHCPAVDTYTSSCAPSLPENAYPDPENTGGLEELLRIALDARVMLRLNLDVADGLSNGARGYVYEVDQLDAEVRQIWVKFDKGGQRWRDAHEHPEAVAIERHTARFFGKDGQAVQRRQFPLRLSWAETVHKSQGATHHGGVHACLDGTMRTPAQAYVALSRSPSLQLLTLEAFDPKCLIVPTGPEWALNELHRASACRQPPKDIEQKALYNELIMPGKPPDFYEQRAAELPAPDWMQQRSWMIDTAEGGEEAAAFTCPFCSFKADNFEQEREHIKTCRRQRARRGSTKERARGRATRPSRSTNSSLPSAFQASDPQTEQPSKRRKLCARALPMPRPKKPRGPSVSPATPLPSSMPPPPLPPPPLAPEQLFFEKQVEARCGMHALNNTLGEELFKPDDLSKAMYAFLEENAELGDSPSDHVGDGGWYSAEVLATALQSVAMARFERVKWAMPLLPVSSAIQIHEAIGILQHRPGPPDHWVSLRSVDGQIFELDSLREAPVALADAEAEALLAMYPASFAVLAV